jgi:hypothetical protein
MVIIRRFSRTPTDVWASQDEDGEDDDDYDDDDDVAR